MIILSFGATSQHPMHSRHLVPPGFSRAVWQTAWLSHSGQSAFQRLITARYFWPEMIKQIKQWALECASCQDAKMHRHTKSGNDLFDVPGACLEIIHIDIVGPSAVTSEHATIFIVSLFADLY